LPAAKNGRTLPGQIHHRITHGITVLFTGFGEPADRSEMRTGTFDRTRMHAEQVGNLRHRTLAVNSAGHPFPMQGVNQLTKGRCGYGR
jgi:hypothetical protein